MHSMLDTWKQSYARMAEDQKKLKEGIETLERENEEYKISNQRLESQLAQRGAGQAYVDPAPYQQPAGQGIVDMSTADSGFTLHRQLKDLHTEPVHSVAMYKDSKMIATGSWDRTVKCYELSSGNTVRTLGGTPDCEMHGLYAVAFAKTQDDILGCTSCDKSVYLWRHTTGECLNTLKGHSNEVNGIDFHASQQVMATASDDKTCLIWDFAEAIMLRTLDKHTEPVYGCKFLGQEMQFSLATCCFDKNTRIFDMRDKSVSACLQLHNDDVIGIDFTSTKGLLATGSDDGMIGIWDSRTWKQVMTINTKLGVSQDNEVKRVTFSPNGQHLAAACSSGKVLVYDIENNGSEVCQLGGHTDCVFDCCWGVDPLTNKKLLVSASHDFTLNFWKEV
jgi:WD40 repeat protein